MAGRNSLDQQRRSGTEGHRNWRPYFCGDDLDPALLSSTVRHPIGFIHVLASADDDDRPLAVRIGDNTVTLRWRPQERDQFSATMTVATLERGYR
jgi:hypothetical protein